MRHGPHGQREDFHRLNVQTPDGSRRHKIVAAERKPSGATRACIYAGPIKKSVSYGKRNPLGLKSTYGPSGLFSMADETLTVAAEFN